MFYTLKTESCHDDNVVVIGGIYNKVGIMTSTLGSKWKRWPLILETKILVA